MTHKLHGKTLLIAVFAVVLVLALGAAVFFSVYLASNSAKAEEQLVLDGNTADYSILNDHSNGVNNFWTYSRSNNEWTTGVKRAGASNNGDEAKASVLTLKVTKDGDIAFQWKLSLASSSAVAVRHYTNVPEDGSLETATVEWIYNKGEVDEFSASRKCFGDEESYQGKLETDTQKNYQNITVSDCKAGDYVTIAYMCDSNGTSNTYNLKVKGLKVPDTQFTITARVADGQSEFGTIKTEREGEVSQEGVLAAKRGYDESVTFTAVPSEGYVAYWTNADGSKIISSTEEYSVSNIAEGNDGSEFTVNFVELADKESLITMTEQSEDNPYWQLTGEGKYELVDIKETEKGSANYIDEQTLIIEFVGDKYLSFDYSLIKENNLSTGSLLSLKIHVDNTYPDGIINGSLKATGSPDAEGSPLRVNVHIAGEGYHKVRLTAYCGGSSNQHLFGNEKLSVENITLSDEAPTENIVVVYDSRLAELYYKDELVPAQNEGEVVEQQLTVPIGISYKIKLVPRTDVISSIDNVSTTSAKFLSGEANVVPLGGSGPSFSTSSGSVEVKLGHYVGKNYAFGSSEYPLNEGESQLRLEFTFIEQAIAPTIHVTKQEGNDIQENIPVTDGQEITFSFLTENSLNVFMQSFDKFAVENFVIEIDGKVYTGHVEDSLAGSLVFALNDVTKHTIKISYTTELYDCSKASMSFTVKEVVDGDISSIVHSEGLSVTAKSFDSSYQWEFDPVHSQEDNYAYGIRVKDIIDSRGFGKYQKVTTQLAFSMDESVEEDAGSITFQFQLGGYIDEGVLWNYLSGQLYYRVNKEFKSSDSGACSGGGNHLLSDATLIARVGKEDTELGNGVVKTADGWYKISIPITKGQKIYIGFLAYYHGTRGSDTIYDDSWVAIRDVNIVVGEKNVTLKVCDDTAGSVQAMYSEASYNASVGSDSTFKASAGGTITLNATLGSDEVFYGWTVNGMLVSTEANAAIFVEGDSEIVAYMAKEHTYAARLEGKFVKTIEDAAKQAQFGQTIIVIDDTEITHNFTINSGVSVIVPYNSENKLTANGVASVSAGTQISWYSTNYKNAYLKVTVKQGVEIIVNGTLGVGGIINYQGYGQPYQGHTSGAYSELVMEEGSSIVVKDGGVMDVYGRVWNGNEELASAATGSIKVENGGVLKQPFLILDYAGGSNTLALFNNGITPFSRYAMVNIEVPYTIEYGAQLVGHASLYVPSMNLLASLDQPFISYNMGNGKGGDGKGANTFVMLHKDAKVTVSYDRSKTVENSANNCTEGVGMTSMVFEGGADICDMKFSLMGISVPTTDVLFSIPYNFQVEMNGKDAVYETKTKFQLLPGATVKVGQGATLQLNADTVVYDGLVQSGMSGKSYPSAELLTANKYYSTNANLIVNGTLKVGAGVTFLGVVQSEGTGTIIIDSTAKLDGDVLAGARGASDCNYAKYHSTARVWDKVHQTVANLQPGKTYTATSGDKWTLPSTQIEYEAANGNHNKNEQGQILDEHKQLETGSTKEVTDMLGSWKVEHSDHLLDWALQEADKKPNVQNKVTEITRYCSELGCDHHETKNLFYAESSLGDLTYTGADVTEAQLNELFGKLFGDSYSAAFEGYVGYRDVKDGYTVTVKPNGLWYNSGSYEESRTMTFNIKPFTLTEDNVDKTKLENLTYNGAEQTPVTLTFNGQLLTADKDYEITYSGNKDAGQASATITGKGNFAGTVELTFEIKPMELVFTATDKTSPEGEAQVKLTYTYTGTLYDDGNEIIQHIELTLSTSLETAKAGDEITINIGFKDSFTAPSNYKVTFKSGTYTVIDPVFKDVVFENSSVEYDGKPHALTATGIPDGAEATYTVEGQAFEGASKVGSYQVTLHIEYNGYTYEQTRTLTIDKCKITVTVLSRTFTYNGETVEASYANGWYTQQGTVVAGEELIITLSGSGKDVGTYPITHEVAGADKDNYEVTFEGAASFEITKAQIAVTLKTLDVTYGDLLPDVKSAIASVTGIVQNEIDVTEYLTFTVNGLATGNSPVGVYTITVAVDTNKTLNNYTISVTGTASYNIIKRTLTVTVNDQNAVYDPEGNYAFDVNGWRITEGRLASGESNSVLNVVLTKPEITNAGSYEITAAYTNSNYEVTILKGNYNVSKLNLPDNDQTVFELYIDGDYFDPDKIYTYSGTALELTAHVYYLLSPETEIGVKVDPSSIAEAGYITVTVTVEDPNYSGERTYTVTVVGEDGLTPRLKEVLESLEALCGDLTIDTLSSTEENFTKLKQAQSLIDSLTEEEKESGAETLAPYTELLQAWNRASELDEGVISTAKAIADAPLKGLLAAVNALLAAVYAALKGGIRK